MPTRTLTRLGAAAVLAVGLLVATSVPASAYATGFLVEASSTINIVKSGTTLANVHLKGHATTNVCAPNSTPPSPDTVSFDSTGGGIIGANASGWHDFVLGTTTYKFRTVLVGGSFTLSATGSSMYLQFRYEFRTCASTAVLCNTNNFGITMTGPSIGHHPTPSTRVTMSGVSTAVTTQPGCNFILAITLNGSTWAETWNIHFV